MLVVLDLDVIADQEMGLVLYIVLGMMLMGAVLRVGFLPLWRGG